jgi:hypothetical protein
LALRTARCPRLACLGVRPNFGVFP